MKRQNHPGAHHQRSQDAQKQNPVLVLQRNTEIGENQGDHKNVVQAQRLLDDVARKKFQRRVAARSNMMLAKSDVEPIVGVSKIYKDVEYQRKENPKPRPEQSLPHLDDMVAPVEDTQIERQQQNY